MKITVLIVALYLSFSIIGNSQGTWNAIPNAPMGSFRIDDITFVNDSVGFVGFNSRIHKTSDKGNTWNQIALLDSMQNYVRSIEFINDSVGFAGLLSTTTPLLGNLYKTTDGGYNWSLLQNMQIDSADGICGMAHFGNRLVAVGTYLGPPWFYRSDDLGLTWMKIDLSNLMEGLVDCYMFSTDTIIISGTADSLNQYRASILKSNDGGLTWTRVYITNSSYLGMCWKMFFRPGGLGIASIESQDSVLIIARTVDYGNNWTTIPVDTTGITRDLGGIGMFNDTLGWVFDQGHYGTWVTWDGALTWNMIISPVDNGDRFIVVDSLTVLTVGSTIYRYNFSPNGINDPVVSTTTSQHSMNIYPNPGNDIITVEAIAVNNTFGILDMFDATGKMAKRITRQSFVKGKNSFQVNIKNLPPGSYSAVWHNNEKRVIKTFTVVH